MVVPSSSESVSSATTTDEQSITTLESTALYQRSVLKKKQQQQQQQQHQQHQQHAAILRTASSSSSSSSSSTSTCTTEATSATSITYASLLDEPEREDDAISTANSNSDNVGDNNNRSGKRRVRFAQLHSSHIRLIPLCFEFDDDDIEALWYGPHEVMQFKQAQRQLAKETRLQGSRLTKPIDTAYRQAQVLAVSVSERGLPQLNTSVLSQPLVPWVRRVQTCRGLEHWASKAHHTCRMDGKNNAKKAVTGSQAMLSLKQSEQDASPLSPMSTQKHTQDMARLYGNASRASFLVARWLGEADAFYKVKQEQEKHLRNQVMREYYLQKIRSMKNHNGQTVESDKEETKSFVEAPQGGAVSQHDVPQQQQELLSRLQQLVQDIDVEEDNKSCASSNNDNDDELDDEDFDDDTTDDNSTIRSTSSSFAARVAASTSSNASNANHHSNHQQHSSWFAVPLTTSSWHRSNTVSSNGSVSSASSSGSRQRRRSSASHNHNGTATTPPHIHQSPPNSIKRAYVRSAGEA